MGKMGKAAAFTGRLWDRRSGLIWDGVMVLL